MTQITYKIEGLNRVKDAFARYPAKISSAIGGAVREASFIVERFAKLALTVGPTRAIDTGRLRASVGIHGMTQLRAYIYPTTNYAVYVHEGTRYMRPRPYMQVAAGDARTDVANVFDLMIAKAIS